MRADAEAIKATGEHENMVMKHDTNKSRENETKRVHSKMIQQTYAGSPAASKKVALEMGQVTTEMSQYSRRLEVGTTN